MKKSAYADDMVYVEAFRYIYRVRHRIMEGDCQYDHGPREVSSPPLYAGRYPVTNRQFFLFLQESGYRPADTTNFLRHWENGRCPENLWDYPVVWVSQSDAKAFASYYGMRLPRDWEWQYLAAGPMKLAYPWGNAFDKTRCAADRLSPVDVFPEGESPCGCFDLCGNTWEWVDDVIDDGDHVFTFLRGGSWYKAPHFWHAEGGPHRNDYHLKMPLLNEGINRNETVGFRCVRDIV